MTRVCRNPHRSTSWGKKGEIRETKEDYGSDSTVAACTETSSSLIECEVCVSAADGLRENLWQHAALPESHTHTEGLSVLSCTLHRTFTSNVVKEFH